jgi:triosephosphate isomerase
MDAVEYGSNTGWVLPEAVKEAGAVGCLINHSEHRVDRQTIEAVVRKAKELKMKTCICAKDAKEGQLLSYLKPDFIAVEPPELIGGEVSVSKAQPWLVKDSVDKIKASNPDVKVLVGAGIVNKEDVIKSIQLGAEGVLVASHIVKSANPEEAIAELIEGLDG